MAISVDREKHPKNSTTTYPIWSGLPLSLVSSCLSCIGPICKSTIMRIILLQTHYKRNRGSKMWNNLPRATQPANGKTINLTPVRSDFKICAFNSQVIYNEALICFQMWLHWQAGQTWGQRSTWRIQAPLTLCKCEKKIYWKEFYMNNIYVLHWRQCVLFFYSLSVFKIMLETHSLYLTC